jgi:hypothetical protein
LWLTRPVPLDCVRDFCRLCRGRETAVGALQPE